MAFSSKYYFDLKSGHYKKKLNEADDNTQNQQNNNLENTTSETTTAPSSPSNNGYKPFEGDEEIQKYIAQINEIQRILRNDISILTKQKENIVKNIDASKDDSVYDPFKGKTISIDEQIEDKTWIANQKIHNIKKQINARIEVLAKEKKQQQITESFIKYNIPEKYHSLNESNVSNAKIYIDDLIDKDDEDCPIKNMNDFKRAFKKSGLIIGRESSNSVKQKKYFVICVDAADVNELQKVLNELGYNEEDVVEVIYQQILDRKNFI